MSNLKLRATESNETEWELLPAGNYLAALEDLEERSSMQMNKEGVFEPSAYLLWKFRIDEEGEFAGRNVWALSSTKLSTRAKARPWVEAILGRALQIDEEIDMEELLGKPCEVKVVIAPDDKNAGQMRNNATDVSPIRRSKTSNGGPIPITESVERAGLIRRYEQATSALGWDAKAAKLQQLMEGYDDVVAHKLPLDKFTELVELFEAKAEQADIPFDGPLSKAEEDELDAAGLVSASPGKKK